MLYNHSWKKYDFYFFLKGFSMSQLEPGRYYLNNIHLFLHPTSCLCSFNRWSPNKSFCRCQLKTDIRHNNTSLSLLVNYSSQQKEKNWPTFVSIFFDCWFERKKAEQQFVSWSVTHNLHNTKINIIFENVTRSKSTLSSLLVYGSTPDRYTAVSWCN